MTYVGPQFLAFFKWEFGEGARVWDKECVIIIPHHYIFTEDKRARRNVYTLRDCAKEQEIKYYYDISDLSKFLANQDYKGMPYRARTWRAAHGPERICSGQLRANATPERSGYS